MFGGVFQALENVGFGVSFLLKPILLLIHYLVMAMFTVINKLVKMTVFHPIELFSTKTVYSSGCKIMSGYAINTCIRSAHAAQVVNSGVVGQTVHNLWPIMSHIGMGMALFMLLVAAFKIHFTPLSGGNVLDGWKEAGGGIAIFTATLISSGYIVNAMLTLNDRFVSMLSTMTSSSIGQGPPESFLSGVATGGTLAIGLAFFGQIVALIAALVLIWALATWFIRQYELIFFTLMLPLTAAAAVGGWKHAWQWNIREISGAIFIQAGQAFAWFLALYIMNNAYGSMWTNLDAFFLSIMGFFFIARVPSYVQALIGQQHSGGMSIAGGMFAGMVGARLAEGAFGMTRGGAAIEEWGSSKINQQRAGLFRSGDAKTLTEKGIPGISQVGWGVGRGISWLGERGRSTTTPKPLRPVALGASKFGEHIVRAGRVVSSPRKVIGQHAERWAGKGVAAKDELEAVRGEAGETGLRVGLGLPRDIPPDAREDWIQWRQARVRERLQRGKQTSGFGPDYT